jgi:hypothetical protein
MSIKIKKFQNFTNQDTLYVFDLDDTLVETPRFEDLVIEYLKEDKTIEDILQRCTKKVNIDIKDLRWENGRVYFDDPNNDINILPNDRNWIRKGKRVYLLTPDEFGKTDISLPTKLKELVNLYNSVENKCIVTARTEEVRNKIEETLNKLGLEYPNYGLYMYPRAKHYQVGIWKGNKILEIIEKNNFTKVEFYDDNSKYIKGVNKVMKEKLPDFNFISKKV